MKKSLTLLTLFFFSGLVAQSDRIDVASRDYGLDEELKLLLVRADLEARNAGNPPPLVTVRAGEDYRLVRPRARPEYGQAYAATHGGETFTLYFTRLPLVKIEAPDWIPNEPKVAANLSYSDGEQSFTSTVGIEKRGSFSQGLPKKTYDLEFWEDPTGNESKDVRFGHLREDDDWVLDGLYNEPLRVNAYVAHKLWLDLHQPYYAAEEPRAKAGVDVLWCEVFMNRRYQGLHLLSEQVDRSLLKLKKFREETREIRGELYKGERPLPGVLLRDVPAPGSNTSDTWDGYELKYPDKDDIINWDNLYGLVSFIIDSPDATFAAEVSDRLRMDNMVDYFLFVNLLGAADNTGNNLYTGRYDGNEPYFYTPWDLDGTFGNNYDGERVDWPINRILTNGLHRRLIEDNVAGFNDRLCDRYGALLESGLFAPDSLMARIRTQYNFLRDNGVYEREAMVWPGSLTTGSDPARYTANWIGERANFMAVWTCDMSVSTEDAPAALTNFLSPNPTTGLVRLSKPLIRPTPWRLFDVAGRLVRHGDLATGAVELDFTTMRGGLYLLRVGKDVFRLVIR